MESNWTSEQVLRYVDPIQKENEELKQQIATYQEKEQQQQEEQKPEQDTQSIVDMAREVNIRHK